MVFLNIEFGEVRYVTMLQKGIEINSVPDLTAIVEFNSLKEDIFSMRHKIRDMEIFVEEFKKGDDEKECDDWDSSELNDGQTTFYDRKKKMAYHCNRSRSRSFYSSKRY